MLGVATNLPAPFTDPMNRVMVIGRMIAAAMVFALCGAVLQAGQPKPNHHEDRHEIDQLEDVWRNAILKSDTNAMAPLLADDYIGITSFGTLQSKDEMLTSLRTHRTRINVLDISDRKVRFYGKTALVTSVANIEANTAEGDVAGNYRYTRVYVRNAQGEWKIVSFEASRIRQPGERRKQGVSGEKHE